MTYKREQKELKISNEDKLLLLCARTRMNKEIKSQITSLIQKEINWDYLLQRSAKHKLKPLLYQELNNVCPDSVPQDVMEHLKTYFLKNTHKNLLFMGVLLKILKSFKSHEITAIPYKGPILAIQAYGNLAFREFDDIDIFVSKRDVLDVKDLLISQNFIPEFELNHLKEIKYIESQREQRFWNNDHNITMDIHWKFSALFFSLPKYFDTLGHDVIITIINDLNVKTLSTEDLLLILCLHNAGHRWMRLSWLCDISELLDNKNVNWSELIKKADKLQIKKILLINIYLVSDLLGFKIPKEISTYLESDKNIIKISNKIKIKIFSEETNLKIFEEIYFCLKLRDNLIFGFKDAVRNLMLPTPLEWEKLNLPIILHPIYYIYRPFYIIMRYKFKKN